MCLGCLDEDEPPATRREFLATALQLTAASALGATTVVEAATQVWDIEASGLTVENGATLLPAYQAIPMGASNQTTVVIIHDRPGIPKDLQELARDVARTGYVALVIDCAQRGTAKISTHPDALLSEAFTLDVEGDVRAGIVTLNGSGPNANPVVILGFGAAGYTALRMALNDPLGVVGVITLSTPIETTEKSKTDPRPDLITLLARLNVPVQFHAGTADPAIDREQLNWLGRFVAVDPDRRELYLYGGAGPGFYLPSSTGFDKGYQVLARKRWQEFLARRFS
ncbi:dienelactone hydrolase family protein [Peristeroidobacter soli]|uniref:dienelactone hydrolase family protein n=1 Tax=Peristeroidobacter soli TaxID=2497877 RepID=UPI00101B8107|nr:dienelactone hydrolase family protein [Peristeroidobacter soli]